MLFGTLPGDSAPPASAVFAALPSYATLIARYLDRYGPYRLQPYAPPTAPYLQPPRLPVAPQPSAGQPSPFAPLHLRHGTSEGRDAPDRVRGRPHDPVGAGPGVLTGYDRFLDAMETVANPFGLGLGFSNPTLSGLAALAGRSIGGALRQGVVDRINEARLKGLINDANRRVQPGAAIGRAGGVGSPGVGGGFVNAPGNRAGRRNVGAASNGGMADRESKGRASNRGPGARGDGFGHFGGPR